MSERTRFEAAARWPGPDEEPRGAMAGSLRRALFERRVVLVTGELDEAQASDVAAALMTLDALGDGRIELRVSGASGGIDAALMVIDVIGVLGVPVDTVGLGIVAGGPVAVLATGKRRLLSPHGRLRLGEPDTEIGGRATDLERALAAQAARREELLRHLASRTGHPVEEIAAAWSRGTNLGAEDAVALGYVDAVQGTGTSRPHPERP